MTARLGIAFALVALGDPRTEEFSPLTYLIHTLNSRQYRGIAEAYLIELGRELHVRAAIYPFIARATRDEKIGLARISPLRAIKVRRADRVHLQGLGRGSRDRRSSSVEVFEGSTRLSASASAGLRRKVGTIPISQPSKRPVVSPPEAVSTAEGRHSDATDAGPAVPA